MAGIKRSEFTENMKDDMYGYFWESYPEVPSQWESLFDVITSSSAYEKFTTAIGLGELLEKPEGEPLQADRPMESYTVICKNRSFGRKVPFSYETVKDAKKTSNFLQTTVGTWGRGLMLTKEKFYAGFFNYGAYAAGHDRFNGTITGVIDDASGDKIYDSQPLFGTHTDRVGNSYSNATASGALTQANLQARWLTYTTTNNRDERGEVIALTPDVLLIPTSLKFTAQVILNTTLIPGSQDNDINTMKAIVEPQEWSYLTDTDCWYLGQRKMGLMATARESVSLDFWQDEETLDYYARIFTRFGGCVTNWRYWYSNNLPTS
jgi:hypothetical protein